ncbi:MAG: DMT family transporter [Acidobacteria bacterium]|nr:DMT family transporter [Acidobacteriota bacterium]
MRAARWQAIAAALLFSTGGAAIKTAAFTGMQVSSVRAGIATLALLVFLRGRIAWTRPALAIGAIYAVSLTLFVNATKLTTAANAIFLQSTAPLYIVVLGPVLLGERLRVRDVPYLAAVGTGLGLCFMAAPAATATAPDPATGNVLGVLCSITWALTLMGLRWAGRHDPAIGLSAVVAGNLFACVAGLPFAWPLPSAPAGEWATLAYLGVVQIGLAYVCLTAAIARLPALEVSLLLLLEPVLNPLWTWLVRGESPGGWVLAGGAVILAATGVKATYDSRGSVPSITAARPAPVSAPHDIPAAPGRDPGTPLPR